MAARRRLLATLTRAEPVDLKDGCGVALDFRPESPRAPVDRIDDLAHLGPELTVETVAGVGKVLRLLRAARLRLPAPDSLVGDADGAAEQLQAALGRPVLLEVRPRASVRFTVWTDDGVESVNDVLDVHEDESSFLVHRLRGRLPVRVPREAVVRRETSRETWLEVTAIERE